MSRDKDQVQDSPPLHDRNEEMPLDLSMRPQLNVESSKCPPTSQIHPELRDKEIVYTREDQERACSGRSRQSQLIGPASAGSYRLPNTISRSQSVQTDGNRTEDISYTTIGMSGGVNIGGTVIGKNVIQTDGCQNIQNLYQSSAQLISHADSTEYVSTYAERSALRNLKQCHSIIIKGRSGSGKSRLGLMLLAEMQTQTGRIPVVLSTPAQWDLIPKAQGKYTVLIDDIFGSTNLVESQLDDWVRCFDSMWPLVESGCIFIVTTSRPEIVAHCENRLRKYKIMKNILDIDEGKYQLKVREKKKFMRKICGNNIFSEQDLDKISRLTTTLGFPQCCRFYASSIKAQSKGAAFFENPHEYILHDVSTMQESDGVAYLSLILVLMRNDSLTGKDLTDSKSTIIERCQQYCRNLPQGITSSDIKHKLESLCGVYLNKQGNAYTFQHQSILDAVFISISREWPHEFMALCPSPVLLEFVRTSRSEDNTSDWVVYINAEDYDVLAEKITRLLLSNDPNDLSIINHPCLKEDAFASYLVDLWEKQKCVVTIISQCLDLDFSMAELFGIEKIAYIGQCRHLGSLMVRKRQHTLVMSCVSKHKFSVKILQDMLSSAICVSDSVLARTLLNMEAPPNNLCLRALSVSGDIADDITDRIFNIAKASQTQNMTESGGKDGYQSETSSDQGSDDQNILYFTDLLLDAVLNGNGHLVDLIVDNFEDYGIDYSEEWYLEHGFLGKFELHLRDIFEEMLYSTERQKYMTEKTSVILKRLISLHDGDFHDADYLMWLAAGHLDARILKVMLQMNVNIWATKDRSENFFHCLVYNPEDLLTFPYCSPWPTALEQAVTHGGPHCLQELLKYIGQQNKGTARSNSQSDTNALPRIENHAPLKCYVMNRFLLHIAAERRDVEKMGMLISAGMAVDIRDYQGNTPLHIAVQCDSLPCVQLLVRSNADINAKNSDERTPLLCIKLQKLTTLYNELLPNLRKKPTEHSNVEIVKCLVESGSDVNHADKQGHTPLLVAVNKNDLSSVRVLIENHADVNYNNPKHCFRETCLDSAIHVACRHSDVEIVKFLCEHGAKVDMKDRHEKTVLHKAADSDTDPMEKLQYLTDVQSVFLHSVDILGRTALFNAVRSGDEEIVDFLLIKGMNINHTDGSMCSVFIHACETSNSSVICLLSKRGANMSVQDKMGNTALHCVVDVGNIQSTKFLLEMNADPRSRNINGKSALHLAAEKNRRDIIKLLLDKGVDPCAPDNEGKTALQYALLTKDSECIRLLLQKGDDKCMQSEEGENALYEEIEKGNSECIKLIIEKGADAHVQDKEGKTLLHHAAEHGKDSIQALLEKGVDPLITDRKGRTALHAAVLDYFADVDCIKLLIDSGVDPNAKDVEGMTALQYAVDNNVSCMQVLVQKGADPYAQDKEGKTIMDHVLYKFSHDIIVKQLLECIDPSIRDYEGKTSLHYAATTEHIETVRIILSKTPDPGVRDKNNMSALHYAAKYSQVSNMILFLENGVDPTIQDKNGKTALHYAAKIHISDVASNSYQQDPEARWGRTAFCQVSMKAKNTVTKLLMKTRVYKTHNYNVFGCAETECIKLLLERENFTYIQDIKGRTALHYACVDSREMGDGGDTVRLLLEHGSDPCVRDKEGTTALHVASASGTSNIVKILLDSGASPCEKDIDERTPLHYAVMKGDTESIKLLLDNGADPCFKDKDNMTALHFGAEILNSDSLELLLRSGAVPWAQDNMGRTALHYAAAVGKIENIQLLRERGTDPYKRDNRGWTALQYAQHTGFSETVEQLINTGALAVQRSRLQLYDLGYYNPYDENQNLNVTPLSNVILNSASTIIRINW